MTLRENLESRQVRIYFGAVIVGAVLALIIPGTTVLESGINPALAFMLFVTFLKVPVAELRQALSHFRFLAALLLTNFAVVPIFVAVLIQFLPPDPMIRLGVLLVLLAPCIDYVVTFSQLGRADARLLLAATPALLIVQMLLLPVYLSAFLGPDAASLIKAGPFVHAFIWLIAVPLILAILVQLWAGKNSFGARAASVLSLFPVPATVVVLFVVVAAVVPQLGPALADTFRVVPIYVAYAVIAPLVGWTMGRLFRLDAPAGRAVVFSAATRNSLVVLPLALAVPGAVPLLPAIIVTQTLVELVSELIYVRLVPKFGRRNTVSAT
ncbi:arsenic resistance protein [Rhizobium leguminosarum bv. viciae]|uniref:arsenic resistance protein n=1 Tax=Rhizobium leguminosarum TaxID=384 RepID=UPI00103F65F3|nr:arsenic resistance protein [Rhizobium leguminosarum]TBY57878.1 arsenic resistance protein [Rhizobium leguminosarum bv. viciae]